MLRTLATALALSLAAGTANAASLMGPNIDCDGSLSAMAGLGVGGKICTAGTLRAAGVRADRGAAGAVFYPLGMGHGIAFGAVPAFVGSAGARRATPRAQQANASHGQGVSSGATGQPPGRRALPVHGGAPGIASGGAHGGAPGIAPGGSGGSAGLALAARGATPRPDLFPSWLAEHAEQAQVTAAQPGSPIPVPLPAAGLLLFGALGALGVIRRRRAAG